MYFKLLTFVLFLSFFSLDVSFGQASTMKNYFGKTFLGKTKDSIPLIFVFNHNGNLVETASGGKLYFFKELYKISIYKANHGGHDHYYGFQMRDDRSLFFAVLDNDLDQHNSQTTLTQQSLEQKMKERGIVLVLR